MEGDEQKEQSAKNVGRNVQRLGAIGFGKLEQLANREQRYYTRHKRQNLDRGAQDEHEDQRNEYHGSEYSFQ